MRYSSRFPLSFGQGKAFLALSLMAFLVACSSEIEQALPAASESGGPVTISVRDVKSRDIVPISVSRDFLRFGGSFSRFHRVGCGGIFWFCLSGIGPRFRLCGG